MTLTVFTWAATSCGAAAPSLTLASLVTLADGEWRGIVTSAMWLAVILMLLAAAFKMTKRVRERGFSLWGNGAGREADNHQDAHMMLTKFRELHARGGLSDDEYRTIKTKLAPELRTGSGAAVAFEEVADEALGDTIDEAADNGAASDASEAS